MGSRITIVLSVFACIMSVSGCAGLAGVMGRVGERMELRQEQRAEYREIEQQERLASRQMESEIRRAHAYSEDSCVERQREAIRDNIQDSVRSKIAFDVDQALQVGQLQVDTAKLKKLIEQRDKEFLERQKVVDELNSEANRIYQEELRMTLREQMRIQTEQPNCGTPPPACSCTCSDCCESQCHRCPHCVFGKHCRHFGSCPEQLNIPKEPVRQAVKQPVLATEIPMMLPVTLKFSMDNPSVEETRIRRETLHDLREPVQDCNPCTSSSNPSGPSSCPPQGCKLPPPRTGSLVPPRPPASEDAAVVRAAEAQVSSRAVKQANRPATRQPASTWLPSPDLYRLPK